MDLSIIIVSYNTKDLLRRCLEALIQDTEIIVVDNGSKDGSVEYLKTQNSKLKTTAKSLKLKIIQNRTNLGFARANNQGIKVAKGKYILLLNSDTEVKSGALGKLIEFAQGHSEAGVIETKLLNPDGSTQPSVYHFPTLWGAIKEYWWGEKGTYEKHVPKSNQPVEVDAVVGAAMLVPKEVFNKVGFLDERYFMYFEDLDFCRRVKKTGFKVYWLPSAKIIHHHGASGREIPKETQKWLVQSSKIYHGIVKHYLINFIIWSSQKWRKFLGNIRA